MKIITLDKTKELLGITNTSNDELIERYITIIDAKVKLMTHNQYNMQIYGDITTGSETIPIYGLTNETGGINNNYSLDTIIEYIEVGSLIAGDNIPDETYINEVYMEDTITPTIDLSAVATGTDTNIILTIGINIGLQPIIAKGIQWLIEQENTTLPEMGWTSQRIGSVSIVRGVAQAEIDGRYGMPVWFVNAFPRYMSGH